MTPKRLLTAVPLALMLVVAGFMMGPAAQSPIVVQIAGVIAPSATPTATETPTSTPTRPPTLTPTVTPIPTETTTPPPTVDPNLRIEHVPIMMYHYVSVPPDESDVYRLDLSVTPDAFDAQMAYLANQGYTTIRVEDLNDHLLHGTPLPPKPIVLTFDDGYVDHYDNVLPVLRKYNFVATFFVITQFIDDHKPGYLNWDQTEELAIEGNEIGSHTLDHIDLFGKSRAIQQREIAGSKKMIEDRIGTPVQSFCYPSGHYDFTSISVLKASGYLSATTEDQGTLQSSEDMFRLRRIRVRGSYSVNEFAHWINFFMSNGK